MCAWCACCICCVAPCAVFAFFAWDFHANHVYSVQHASTCELQQYQANESDCNVGTTYEWNVTSLEECGDILLRHLDECLQGSPRQMNVLYSCFVDCDARKFKFGAGTKTKIGWYFPTNHKGNTYLVMLIMWVLFGPVIIGGIVSAVMNV